MSLDQELLAQIDKYKEIMQKDPNSREFLTLADLYRKLGVAEEATNILKDGLKKHPDYVDARLSIARIFLTQGQVEDATREFEEVIRQDRTNFVAFKLLGEIAMQKQEHEKAAERFGAAYQLKSDDQECKVMLDYIGSLLGRDITPNIGGAPAVPPPPKATLAVAPEGEFGEFEVAEEMDEFGGLGDMDELGEIEEEEALEEFEEAEEIPEFEDIESLAEPEEFDEIDEFEEIEPFDEAGGEPEEPDAGAMAEFGEEPEFEEVGDAFEDLEGPEEGIEEDLAEEFEEVEEEFAEEFEEVEEIEEFAEEFEEVIEEVEEIEEEIEEIEEDFLDTKGLPDIDDFAEEMGAPAEVEAIEEIEELAEGDEELVTQIFQDLSDSEYTSGAGGMLEDSDDELDDLMGLLESEETEGLAAEMNLRAARKPSGRGGEPEDLESLIDLEGVPGMEEVGGAEELFEEPADAEIEEIEEIEEFDESGFVEEVEEFGEVEEFEEIETGAAFEDFEEVPEPQEEVEEVGEFDELGVFEREDVPDLANAEAEMEGAETTDVSEQSSIFEDFGISGESEELDEGTGGGSGGGDVFQDFDFDVFEQELLKDHAPQDLTDGVDESEAEAAEAETPELEELEEIIEEEAFIAEEFEEGEGELEEELPDASLAELYIKQDLFGEATQIYRTLLQHDPRDKQIKQILEETLALQAYVEGTEA